MSKNIEDEYGVESFNPSADSKKTASETPVDQKKQSAKTDFGDYGVETIPNVKAEPFNPTKAVYKTQKKKVGEAPKTEDGEEIDEENIYGEGELMENTEEDYLKLME